MYSLIAQNRRTLYLRLFIITMLLQAAMLPAETNNRRHSSSIDFAEAPEIQIQVEKDVLWLEDADRLMEELHRLDVRMYTLISRIGNNESRGKLIEQRGLNRQLIYDLLSERNNVVRRIEENGLDVDSL